MYSYYSYTTKHACLMVLVHLALVVCKPNSGLADCNQRSPYSTIKTTTQNLQTPIMHIWAAELY